ncbi:MAG: ABC transporter substrate-binding protein [Burkholderiales bacterium]|nr:ABC transporter substrate-binding protein [Burkholderiales bacterium]
MDRRTFNSAMAAGATTALTPFGIARAQSGKLKVGVLLPRSGVQGLIGQSCQIGADIAPTLIKDILGVDVELMNADTESNVDTARTRAERLIQEGAHVLVGPFDSGAAAAIAQVAEQRGVPFVINIAAAPQITEQGYKFVFRNFPTAIDLTVNGLALIGDLFRAVNVAPRTAVFMHVNDTFGQAMNRGISGTLPKLTNLPFRIVETISYDPAAKDLSVEVSKAKATKADFLLLVCRLNDAIILRREIVKQRWNMMGMVSPGSPGIYEKQFMSSLGKLAEYCISNNPWYNPKTSMTAAVVKQMAKQFPNEKLHHHGANVSYTFESILIAADGFKRARSTNPKELADAIRQVNFTDRVSLGGPIRFNAKGQVEGCLSACLMNKDGRAQVILPASAAETKPVFPWPDFKA